MNLKALFSLFSPPKPGPLVRIDGSLSGEAIFDEGVLHRFKEHAEQLSAQRPYTFDLDLSAGRFSLIVAEAVVPREAFVPDPEQMLGADLQQLLERLPPEKRTRLRCTFRALWREGEEVQGVVFLVEPPGKIVSQLRVRHAEEYDRLAEEQAQEGYVVPRKSRLPRWSTYVVGFLVLVVGTFFLYRESPERRLQILDDLLMEVELTGLDDLIEIEEYKVTLEGLLITLSPLEGYQDTLTGLLAAGDSAANAEDPGSARMARLKMLAAQALIKGRLHLEVFNEENILLDTLPLDVSAFDGTEALTVKTRPLQLHDHPARVRIGP
jgi:hypothetical protein